MEDNKVFKYVTSEGPNKEPETLMLEPKVDIEPQVAIVKPDAVEPTSPETKMELAKEPSLKDKYGEVYEVELSFDINEDNRARLLYCFKKPNVSSYDRYIKSMSKSPAQASRMFVIDNVIKEQKAELAANLEKYPAAAMSISGKLLEMLGFGDVSLTQL